MSIIRPYEEIMKAIDRNQPKENGTSLANIVIEYRREHEQEILNTVGLLNGAIDAVIAKSTNQNGVKFMMHKTKWKTMFFLIHELVMANYPLVVYFNDEYDLIVDIDLSIPPIVEKKYFYTLLCRTSNPITEDEKCAVLHHLLHQLKAIE